MKTLRILLLSAFSLQAFSLFCAAQNAATQATVTGRVLNVATGQYLKNAEVRLAGTNNYVYTEDDGSYSITVRAGAVELVASYIGARTGTATINASPGVANVLNFDLQPIILDPATTTEATGTVVTLDRFTVTAEREGQARAIMDQRAAINATTIIAIDNYGDVTMGSVGEVLKYMPGITVDYYDTDATGVRIGGLDPKYTTASLDGIAVSTAARTIDLNNLTTIGVETIEFIQTLTASMDASSGAGRINFVTKDPFSRKGAQLRYQFGLNGHNTAFNLGRSYLPDDRKHYLTMPGGLINYGNVFFNGRFAVELNLSYNGSYNFSQLHNIYYSYRNPDAEITPDMDYISNEPTIVELNWRPMPELIDKYAGNLNLAYKLTPKLTFSVRSGFNHDERDTMNLFTYLRTWRGGSGPTYYSPNSVVDRIDSTLTHWVVNGIGDSMARLQTFYSHRKHTTYMRYITPRLTYKRQNLTIDFNAGYTATNKMHRDADLGFFRAAASGITNISWVADRPSTSSPTWTLTQTGGDPWVIPENWSRRDYYADGVRSNEERSRMTQYVGALDVSYAHRVFGVPVTFKAGGFIRSNDYSWRAGEQYYNYLGPTGRPQEVRVPYTQNYMFQFPLGGKGGNISDQNWRVDDTYTAYRTFQEHPEWFTAPTTDNLRRKITSRRDLTEDINAGYFELNARHNRLRFNIGGRVEATDVETWVQMRRTGEELTDAGYPVNASGDATTEEGVRYQYYDGQRVMRTRSYTNYFFSGGLKYDFTRNLQAQLSASQSILRPDYDNLAGTVTVDTNDLYIRIPNATLKPECMTKYYAGINYKFEPAGTLQLSAYRMDIKDKQIRNIEIDINEAERILGYSLRSSTPSGDIDLDADNAHGTIYYTAINSPSLLSVYGVTLEYNQQLVFLPGLLKGLSIFSSVTLSSIHGSQIDEDKIGQVKRSANGGLRYSLARFNLQLRGTWTGDTLAAVTRPLEGSYHFYQDHQYAKSRLIIDLSGGFKLTNRYELTFSVRNLTNSPQIWYSNVPDRLSRYTLIGSYVNISLKGSF